MLQALLETFESVLRSWLAGKEATNRHQADHQLVVALSRNVGARGPSEGLGILGPPLGLPGAPWASSADPLGLLVVPGGSSG